MKTFCVMCIDKYGVGSWEEVIQNSSENDGTMLGTIVRTKHTVKFWYSGEDSEDEYTGLIL